MPSRPSDSRCCFCWRFGFGFGNMFQRAGQGNYIQFLSPGVMTMSILFTSIFSGIEVIWDRQFGFLKETLVAPVPRILIMIGRTLGGATVAGSRAYRGVLHLPRRRLPPCTSLSSCPWDSSLDS